MREELKDFYNDGSGWTCRACAAELAVAAKPRPGIFAEGEAENKTSDLEHRALAKWTDATREHLTCPRCGITEQVDRH